MKTFNHHKAVWLVIFCLASVACNNISPQAANNLANNQETGKQMSELEKSWQLTHLNSTAGTVSALAGATLSMQQGKISGMGTCNHYGGSYHLQGKQLSIDLSQQSMMACAEPERMTQEQRYFELLGQVASYQLAGGKLQLLNAQGTVLLVFTAAK